VIVLCEEGSMKSILFVSTLAAVLSSSSLAQDTVRVKAGWNIIGSVKAGAVSDVLFDDPDSIITTSFYGYVPGSGYQSSDTLEKALGYWVKVSADGVIIFKTDNSIDGLCGAKRVMYDGVLYHTVQIGSQCWLEENLNAGTLVAGVNDQTNNGITEKYCYENSPLNCALYGGLYQWGEAMQYASTPAAKGVCPSGWHIPTLSEFQTLSSTFADNGNALKAVGQGTGIGAGTNSSGFSGLLAGYRDGLGFFLYLGGRAACWSSTELDAGNANVLTLYDYDAHVDLDNGGGQMGFSVRCLAD
jgi:uncharacterized protein (TIGR02145 family)